MQIFCATNECDSDCKKWCFLLKQMVNKKKKVWHKQDYDSNGGDYKRDLLYLNWVEKYV